MPTEGIDRAAAVYRFIQAHALMGNGRRVCRERLYPWMMAEFGLDIRAVKGAGAAAVKELQRQSLVRRPNPRSTLLILTD